jgi:N-glycosylase/DNA lyase
VEKMKTLLESIEKLKRSHISQQIRSKMERFEGARKDRRRVFSELCFCLLTANSSAEMGMKVQNAMDRNNGFVAFGEHELAKQLRSLGYRFYNVRAKYIVEARKNEPALWLAIKEGENEPDLRDWLVDNFKGLGYKEASHLLRNLGFENVAILDRHILRTLHEQGLIDSVPKTLDRKRYLKYEKELERICRIVKLKQGELDFYLWYLKTGKILK